MELKKNQFCSFIHEKLSENNFKFLLELSDWFRDYLLNMTIELIEETKKGNVLWIHTISHPQRLNFRIEKNNPKSIISTGPLASVITKQELYIIEDLFTEFASKYCLIKGNSNI